MEVSAAAWSTISKLLDEALDLEPAARVAWLQRLTVERPDVAPAVRKLLEVHATAETDDVLARLPALALPPDTLDRPSDVASGDRVGPYRLLRALGSGGMSDVWLAERADGAFTREVALKLPLVNRLRRDLAERFARERDILARLEHPHIARLYDAGVDADGLPYLAMEYVDGQTIAEYSDAKRLDIAGRLRLFDQVLDAVQYAHGNLVIHRDLKPSNVLVTSDGQVRLLDFGIAKLLADDESARETQLTRLAGRALTPDYASPEQIRGEALTIATDVYSLGVVLFELLTGARPYRLKLTSAAQLEQAIIATDPVKPSAGINGDAAAWARSTTASRLARMLAGDLDTIVLKALAKAPSQRYASAAAFADDLHRHLAGEPVHARPASWRYRTRKFIGRHRVAVGATGAIGAALLAAAAVSLWQAQLARAQAQRAEQVKTFVLSMFQEADTYSGSRGSRKTTAVDLLSQARARLTSAHVADPAINVELLTSIGSSLIGLGEHKTAADVLEEATRLAIGRLGADHPNTFAAQLEYGGALILVGALEPAASMLDAAERGMRRTGNAVGLITALRWKAFLRAHQQRFDEAIALAADAVRLVEAQPTRLDRRVAMETYLTLAGAMGTVHRTGRLEPARRAYEMAREIYGDRPSVPLLHARSLYAYALIVEGDAGLGVSELQALVPQQIELLGADHIEVKESYARIGNAALSRGDPLTAIETYREALRIETAASGGAATSAVGLQRYRLGSALASARRYEAAELELREAERILASRLGADHPDVRRARAAIGQVLTRTGRLNEAETVFRPLLAQPLDQSLDAASIRLRLGTLRSAQGRHGEALQLIRQAAEFFSGQAIPSAYARALAALGEARLEAGHPSDAADALKRANALFERLQPERSPEHADVLIDLARTQMALDRIDEAVAAARAAAEFWDRFDPANRSAGIAHLWHARALIAAGRAREAHAAMQRAASTLKATALPPDRALLAQAQHELHAGR